MDLVLNWVPEFFPKRSKPGLVKLVSWWIWVVWTWFWIGFLCLLCGFKAWILKNVFLWCCGIHFWGVELTDLIHWVRLLMRSLVLRSCPVAEIEVPNSHLQWRLYPFVWVIKGESLKHSTKMWKNIVVTWLLRIRQQGVVLQIIRITTCLREVIARRYLS